MKISIITINLNNKIGLEKTIKSVLVQEYFDFEYLIIDGGSIDGSKELIESNGKKLTYWKSEKDKGVYNAMNKGILKSKGEYVLFLNSGDSLYNSKTLKSVSRQLKNDIVYGNVLITNKNGEIGKAVYPRKLDFSFFVHLSLPHPASFIKKELFSKTGFFDESLLICSDWKFFIDAVCRYRCSYKYIDIIVSEFREDGISATSESSKIIQSEREYVLERFYLAQYDNYKKSGNVKSEIESKFSLLNYLKKRKNIFNKKTWR